MKNFFDYPETIEQPGSPELIENMLHGPGMCRVERIVSWGHATPEGEWYDQELDEWALVLEGAAVLECEGRGETRLRRGDSIFLPRHLRHRVRGTSHPCIWLTIHGNMSIPPRPDES